MSLLLPLGLLGLLSILVLILIYILKPNYQQKVISSTFVWKLSLKYRKKRIPISKLRNILIIICQILILTGLSFVLSYPVIAGEKVEAKEEVLIIDASGSMLIETDGESRFVRAVDQVTDRVNALFEEDGIVSIIVADTDPYFVAQRATKDSVSIILDKLFDLAPIGSEETACSYQSADMEKSVEMAQNVLIENPKAKVYFYTATTYNDTNNINIEYVGNEDEWNVAILDAKVEYGEDNYYNITVDVGCYNNSKNITLYCEVTGPNGDPFEVLTLESDPFFFNPLEEETKFEFTSQMQADQFGEGNKLYSFESLRIYVEEADNFDDDNTYWVYGGVKEKIRVQYASSLPNRFFSSALSSISYALENVWDIEYSVVEIDPRKAENEQEYELEGFDFYIFEHTMPSKMPDDGVVFLVDPVEAPQGSGLRIEPQYYGAQPGGKVYLESYGDHPLLNNMNGAIFATKFSKIMSHDGYDELLYLQGNPDFPMLLAKNTDDMKVAVLATDLNYSNLAMLKDFPILLLNMFNYFIPATVTDYVFQVGEKITLNARGPELNVTGGDIDETFTEFPAEIVVETPGVYTMTQIDISGEFITESFFVGYSSYESNISKVVNKLPLLYVEDEIENEDKDLLVYFAAAIVALLFIEWWLQSREYF